MIRRLVLLLIMLVWACPARAEHHHLRVYAAELPPFSYQDASGLAAGISVDILEEIAARAGDPIIREDIRFIPWPRAMEETRNDPRAVLLSPGMTPERKNLFRWIGPVHGLRLGLLAKKSRHLDVPEHGPLPGLHIAAIRDSAPVQLLRAAYEVDEHQLVLVADDEQQFAMLERGRVDLVTHGAEAAPLFLRRLGIDPSGYEMVRLLKHLELYIAFNKDVDGELFARLEAAFRDLKDKRVDGGSFYEDVIHRHLGPNAIPAR